MGGDFRPFVKGQLKTLEATFNQYLSQYDPTKCVLRGDGGLHSRVGGLVDNCIRECGAGGRDLHSRIGGLWAVEYAHWARAGTCTSSLDRG